MKRLRSEYLLNLRLARVPAESRRVVGERVGIHRHTLERWEKQEIFRFDHNSITSLAEYYGVPVDTLLEDVPPPDTDATATGSE